MKCASTWFDDYRFVGYGNLNATPLFVIKSDSERGYWALDQGWVFDIASAVRFPIGSGELNDWTFKPVSSGDDAKLVELEHCSDYATGDCHE
jgi:hypothetical protein